MTDKQNLDLLHIKVHSLRMIAGYKASVFEQEISRLISEWYKDECKECNEKHNFYKYNPIQTPKSGIMGLFGGK